MTREKPILFKAPMIRAIRDDRKWQTRRIYPGSVQHYGYVTPARQRPMWRVQRLCDASCVHPPYDGRHAVAWGPMPYAPGDRSFWRPAIFLPRWASRLTLEVTEVRIQRLKAISGEDAAAEGVSVPRCECEVCRRSSAMCPADASAHVLEFACLWDSINGDSAPWSCNPWVVASSFRRMR